MYRARTMDNVYNGYSVYNVKIVSFTEYNQNQARTANFRQTGSKLRYTSVQYPTTDENR